MQLLRVVRLCTPGFVISTALGLALASDTRMQFSETDGDAEFHFVRLQYSNHPYTRGRGWSTDWPEAEQHLIQGIQRLSRVRVDRETRYLPLMDEKLFDYPFLYAVEVGQWYLSEAEVARLRDYLLRGGSLMVDDFHGTLEWQRFNETMSRVFPDRPIVDIPLNDPVFHVVHDLEERVQIPGLYAHYSGVTYEADGYKPQWRGVYDDQGRLMVIVNFNMDLGDAWEHADTPDYALQYTTLAYKYAVNYLVYAMTH